MVPSWSKNALVGMKYPASMMIGGRMTVKNRLASNSMISFWSLLKYVIIPRMMPTTIRRQLSGHRFSRRLLAWKPAQYRHKTKQRHVPPSRTCQLGFQISKHPKKLGKHQSLLLF